MKNYNEALAALAQNPYDLELDRDMDDLRELVARRQAETARAASVRREAPRVQAMLIPVHAK